MDGGFAKVKVSKKVLKQRAARFAADAVPEAPKKVMSHSEGIVMLSADPKQKLVDLCKRKIAAGEKLTDIQYDALLRYGVLDQVPGASRGIVGVSTTKEVKPSPVASSKPAGNSGQKRPREDSVASSTPKVVLRSGQTQGASASASSSASTSGAGAMPVVVKRDGTQAGGSGSGTPVVLKRDSLTLLENLPKKRNKRIKHLKRVLQRLASLQDKKSRGESLTATEASELAQVPAVSAALNDTVGRGGGDDDGDDSS